MGKAIWERVAALGSGFWWVVATAGNLVNLYQFGAWLTHRVATWHKLPLIDWRIWIGPGLLGVLAFAIEINFRLQRTKARQGRAVVPRPSAWECGLARLGLVPSARLKMEPGKTAMGIKDHRLVLVIVGGDRGCRVDRCALYDDSGVQGGAMEPLPGSVTPPFPLRAHEAVDVTFSGTGIVAGLSSVIPRGHDAAIGAEIELASGRRIHPRPLTIPSAMLDSCRAGSGWTRAPEGDWRLP